MSWRVSPVAPRALEVLGASYEDAWTANRTTLVERLQSIGEHQLAGHYTAYYLAAWQYFLSGYQDGRAGRDAIRFGAAAISRGQEIGRQVVSSNSAQDDLSSRL